MIKVIEFICFFLLTISLSHANTSMTLWTFEAPPAIIRTGIDYTYFSFPKENLVNFQENLTHKIDANETIDLISSKYLNDLFEKYQNDEIQVEDVIQTCYRSNIAYLINIKKKIIGATLSSRVTSYSTNKTNDLFGTVVLEVKIIDTKTGKIFKNFSIKNEGLIGSGLPITLFVNIETYLINEMHKKLTNMVIESD